MMDAPDATGAAADASIETTPSPGRSRDEVHAEVVRLEGELNAALAELKIIEDRGDASGLDE